MCASIDDASGVVALVVSVFALDACGAKGNGVDRSGPKTTRRSSGGGACVRVGGADKSRFFTPMRKKAARARPSKSLGPRPAEREAWRARARQRGTYTLALPREPGLEVCRAGRAGMGRVGAAAGAGWSWWWCVWSLVTAGLQEEDHVAQTQTSLWEKATQVQSSPVQSSRAGSLLAERTVDARVTDWSSPEHAYITADRARGCSGGRPRPRCGVPPPP